MNQIVSFIGLSYILEQMKTCIFYGCVEMVKCTYLLNSKLFCHNLLNLQNLYQVFAHICLPYIILYQKTLIPKFNKP